MAIIRIKGASINDHYHECKGCGATSEPEDCSESARDCVDLRCRTCNHLGKRRK